ncbi:mechanosensitive ion channel family protein [Cyanobium sp. LEGE 06113]|uniref:mechanosensitive ion channel family protein n=1 Tax=Cyanobium sp. LEGE 06113 TaxID=1297573 RepID=UPI001881F43E|nr:mechanosensitive ion channel domain-containing protein [Cyanobium sp. LEGE 06113]MBE9155066.1 mechanosensitive ion channel [Cyanobium sp. LEGE 06113]
MLAVLLAIGPMHQVSLAQPALQPLASQQLTAQAKQDTAKPDTKSAATDPADDAGAWVMLDGRRVIEIKSAAGAQNPKDVARRITGQLQRLVRDPRFRADRIVVRDQDPYATVGLLASDGKFLPGLAVDDRAAKQAGLSRQALAERYRDQIRTAVRDYRVRNSRRSWIVGTLLAMLVLGVYVLWVRWQQRLHRRLLRWLSRRSVALAPRLKLGEQTLVTPAQTIVTTRLLLNTAHWGALLLISWLLIPLLLSFFPPTQAMAEGLRGQLLTWFMQVVRAVLSLVPNFFWMGFIAVCTALMVRLSNFLFGALRRGRLKISWFYREWAIPTRRIANTFIVLAGLLFAFPYIPGSDSRAFQGAGLLFGVLAALGSSAAATNVISGLMLIYTRAFLEGDRVEINGVIGLVQERALLVTRIRTPRNELVSIPNAAVITSSVVNYSFSRREIRKPVAVCTTVTIGYDVPWRQVHELMISAAKSVEGISREAEPFVLQTSLNDFNISYELTASIRDSKKYRETLSELLGAIQDQFADAKIEILSPGYHAMRNGNPSTLPPPLTPQDNATP